MMNTFRVAYPESRTLTGQVFRPVVDPRTYLRALHLFAMFPLGIAYFVSLVALLAFGGSLIWTFPGALVVLFTIFGSRLVGDLESIIVSRVAETEIKRPPWRTEGVEGWRSRLWIRLIDPTTWTGIVYLFIQFPIGIGVFVSLVVSFAISGSFIASPLIIHFTGDPLEMEFAGWSLLIDKPVEAIWLIPIGLLMLLFTVHLVTAASALHAVWAKFMLGSRASAIQQSSLPPEPPKPDSHESVTAPPDHPRPDPGDTVRPFGPTAHQSGILRSETPPADRHSVPGADRHPAPGERVAPPIPLAERTLLESLTSREYEVLLLLARGMTNAEIAESCVISQGTVKTHVKRILAKLQLHDRTQVVVFAYETGLVSPGPEQPAWSAVSSSQAPFIFWHSDRHRPL